MARMHTLHIVMRVSRFYRDAVADVNCHLDTSRIVSFVLFVIDIYW